MNFNYLNAYHYLSHVKRLLCHTYYLVIFQSFCYAKEVLNKIVILGYTLQFSPYNAHWSNNCNLDIPYVWGTEA